MMLAKQMLFAPLVVFLAILAEGNLDAQGNNQVVPTLPPTTTQQSSTLVPPTNIQSAPVQGTQQLVVPQQSFPQQQQRLVQPQQGFPQKQGFPQQQFTQPQQVVPQQQFQQQQFGQQGNFQQQLGNFQQGGVQQQFQQPPNALSKAQLRDIETMTSQLTQYTKMLHDQHHAFLEGQRHGQKLDDDVTALERQAEALQATVTQSDGSQQSMQQMRGSASDFLQLSFRISRTIDLTQPWLRGGQAQNGITQMRQVAQGTTTIALRVDQYLPVDTQLIDRQTEILEAAVKELHDEFHEHLEGYEVSRHLDEDLEGVETLVEHMHGLAHNKNWGQINFTHLWQDIGQVKQKTAHIESLFVRQAQIGVRTQDWIGIEHSRDAITDVLSSAYLLEHMIRKTQPVQQQQPIRQPIRDTRPLRDRHGHPVDPNRALDRHGHSRDHR